MDNLINKIRDLGWEELNFENGISIQDSDTSILSSENGLATFHFTQRKVSDSGEITFVDLYSNLKSIHFPIDFPLENVLTRDLKLKFYTQLNDIFNFNSKSISNILIDNGTDTFEIQEHEHRILISPETLNEILDSYSGIYDESKSYSKKFVTYKSNEFQRSYFGIEKEKKTLSNKGEFSFLVDRFNLPTKRKRADFEKYLNENDILSLQDLSLKLIQKEVFGNDFLIKLNDYFIKAKLEDIIKLGREILSLKSPSINTIAARKTIKKVESDGRRIKQLESVWQKYFENFLSFLIFSYQNLYPKIELNVNLKKKYPDFIGINHFGGVDILEIKTHLKRAVTKDPSHDNYAFSSELSKAIIQTINYMDALIQEKIKKKTEREDLKGKILEGNIYRPRGIIIISSYDNLASGVKTTDAEFEIVKRDFTKLRHGLNNIQILTFNEILDMAENYKDNIIK